MSLTDSIDGRAGARRASLACLAMATSSLLLSAVAAAASAPAVHEYRVSVDPDLATLEVAARFAAPVDAVTDRKSVV